MIYKRNGTSFLKLFLFLFFTSKKRIMKQTNKKMMLSGVPSKGGGVARKTLLKPSTKKIIKKNKQKITGGRGRTSMNSGDIDPKAHKIYASSQRRRKGKKGKGGLFGGVKKALKAGKRAASLPGKIASNKTLKKAVKTGGKILRTADTAASLAKALG